MKVARHVELARRTTFGVGGPASALVEVTDDAELGEALDQAAALGLPAFVLGGGSNLLVADRGLDALVVRLSLRGLTVQRAGDVAVLRAAAGEPWDGVVARAVAEGLGGLECLSGIPGDTGATPIQNVGAYGQEVGDVIEGVEVIDRVTRERRVMDAAACAFSYRDSVFKGALRGRFVVTAVILRLRPSTESTVRYAELERAVGPRAPLAAVRDAVVRLRRAKGMVLDPADFDTCSAGSFFTNPIVAATEAALVLERARTAGMLGADDAMPTWPVTGDMVKLSAAWLIERSGFTKGTRRGRAGVSSKHSLALVNTGGATAAELIALAREIEDTVRRKLGVRLRPEPELVGFTAAELGSLAGTDPR